LELCNQLPPPLLQACWERSKRWRLHSWPDRRNDWGHARTPTKISFGEMRDSSVRGLLVYCADCRSDPSVILRQGW